MGDEGCTHQWFTKASVVGHGCHCTMEIVQVYLARRLEFVEKVKETERKGSGRSLPGGREPAST